MKLNWTLSPFELGYADLREEALLEWRAHARKLTSGQCDECLHVFGDDAGIRSPGQSGYGGYRAREWLRVIYAKAVTDC